MTQATINFRIKGTHESHSGEATVVAWYKEGHKVASESFEGAFSTNKIGSYQDGVIDGSDRYVVYENYQDSGSNDYIYFAIKIEE